MYDVNANWRSPFVRHLCSFFMNFIDDLAEIGTASLIFKMKVLRASMTLRKTVLCLNVYLLCCSDTFQAPKICAEQYIHLYYIGCTWLQLSFSIFRGW